MQLMGISERGMVNSLVAGALPDEAAAKSLLSSGLLADLLSDRVDWSKVNRDEFRRLLGLPPLMPTYQVAITRVRLHVMIKRGGYGWIHPQIKAVNFPMERLEQWQVAIALMGFRQNTSTAEVLRVAAGEGYRPAYLPELLALGEIYPDLQWARPIVSLGSRWKNADGLDCVPILRRHEDKRALALAWYEQVWGHICQFAMVRIGDGSLLLAA